MKRVIELLGIILVDSLLVISLGLSFSVIFMIASLWFVYGMITVRRIANKYKKKWLRVISKVYTLGVVLFISSFMMIEGFLLLNIAQYKAPQEIEALDYVIVLGAGLRGEKVSPTLKARLDQAIAYYKLHPDTMIIVSGGQGEDEVIPEAEAMRRYLEKMGIPKEHILKEDRSRTTLENIAFSQELLVERGEEDKKVLIVTHDYHLFRAQMLAYFMDLKSEGLAAESASLVGMNYLIREYPTLIIDFIRMIFIY